MARTSRKHLQLGENPPVDRIFKTGIYVRLSVKEEGGKTDTIENQEALIRGYLEGKPEFQVVKVYSDHGRSGTNFQREGYQELRQDLNNKLIDCIIIKDFSRYARNYLGAGEFLETFFESTDIRFISVNDNFDSFSATASEQQLMHLTNLSHQFYAQDISRKAAPVIEKNQKEGRFIGAWAPYGYALSPLDRYKLVVNHEVADYVREIFNLRIQGTSVQNIARSLNERNILSPTRYLYEKGQLYHDKWKSNTWYLYTVKKILENQVYLGHMVQGKTKVSLAHGIEKSIVPKEDWIIVPHVHEAIISEAVFEEVQRIHGVKKAEYYQKQGRYDDLPPSENLFKGIIYCEECGTKLFRYKSAKKRKDGQTTRTYTFTCPTHSTTLTACSFTSIPEITLVKAVTSVLHSQWKLAQDVNKVLSSPKFKQEEIQRKQKYTTEHRHLTQEKARVSQLKFGLYDSYLNEDISSDDYKIFSMEYEDTILSLSEAIETLEETFALESLQTPQENRWLKQALSFSSTEELTSTLVHAFVEKIIVYNDKSIEIILKFQDEYKKILATTGKETAYE